MSSRAVAFLLIIQGVLIIIWSMATIYLILLFVVSTWFFFYTLILGIFAIIPIVMGREITVGKDETSSIRGWIGISLLIGYFPTIYWLQLELFPFVINYQFGPFIIGTLVYIIPSILIYFIHRISMSNREISFDES